MCVDTYFYIPTAKVFFLVGLPMDCRGWGVVFGECTMDPGLGQTCVPSLKKTTNWATVFLVHSKKGKGLKVVWVRVRKGAWILCAWLTLESSSLFFDSFLFGLFSSFFLWGGGFQFFCRIAPLRQPFSPHKNILDLVWDFFLIFYGSLSTSSLLKTLFFYPHCPSFSAVQVWGGWGGGHTLALVVCCWFGVCGLEMPVEGSLYKH